MPDINWDVPAPSAGGYGSAAPTNIAQMLATLGQQPQQQQGPQPGQPLNISPQGPGGPSWFDKLRSYLTGTATPTTAPNPNPPSPTDVGTPGLGPTPSPGPTPGYGGVDDFTSRYYFNPTPMQAGGAVAPGYAGRFMGNMAAPGVPAPSPGAPAGTPAPGGPPPAMPANAQAFPMAAGLFNRFGNPPPGYTSGGNIG